MSKLISALKRTIVGAPDGEAPVHFHQGMTDRSARSATTVAVPSALGLNAV